jgi:predicted nucleic acid-binding protein
LGVDRLRAALRPHSLVAVDTSIFIYQLDLNQRYFDLCDAIFAWLGQRGRSAVCSTLSLTELLVPAYQEGNDRRIEAYYAFLSTFPNLTWVPPDFQIADKAAQLRAMYRLKTPDAIQAATAIHSNATAFLTNDSVFKRVKNLNNLVLDDYL